MYAGYTTTRISEATRQWNLLNSAAELSENFTNRYWVNRFYSALRKLSNDYPVKFERFIAEMQDEYQQDCTCRPDGEGPMCEFCKGMKGEE